MLRLYLLLQAAAAPPAPVTIDADSRRFDLAKLPAATCDPLATTGDEIVVCARKNLSAIPPDMAELEARYGPKPFKPGTRMLGGEGSVGVRQVGTISGSAPALMFNFLKKF